MKLNEAKKNLEVIASGKGIDLIGRETIQETAAAAVKLADIQIRLNGYIENINKEYCEKHVYLSMDQVMDMMRIFEYKEGEEI